METSRSSQRLTILETQVDVTVTYRGQPLPQHAIEKPFRYLGVLVTLTLDYKFEKARVMRKTRLRLEALSKAQLLSYGMRETAVKLGVVSVFRYSAGLVPWTSTELDDLTTQWVGGFRGAWHMPTVDTSLFRLSPRHGGRGCPTAHEVWILEAMSLILQCLHKRGVIAQLMVDDLQQACVHRGCLSLYQLQRFLRLVPTRGLKSWVEKLMSKLDSLGLDVGADLWDVPANPPLLISEALWQHYWATGEPDLREEVPSILSGCLVTWVNLLNMAYGTRPS